MRNNDIRDSRRLGVWLTLAGGVLTALAAGAAVAATLHMDGAAPLCGPVSQHCILCFAAAASLLASVGVIASGVMLMRSPQPAAATVGPRP
ncbi:MAG: hypothetical protein KKG14_01360 [Alphaproteobacteria bacterium]|nr:hypothetical protein [Alphaproteobacteria bacterium]MBU2270750.1 hypothetical protein [Alphaproteobacteria bacterium]MBU2417334.1 hypothetical protein [Alphaproteobacteria bacterium]